MTKKNIKLASLNYQPIFDFLEKNQDIIVAVSGGLDSIALFRLLWDLSRAKKNFSLAVCHVNFGLRGKESDADEAFVRQLAAEHEVPIYVRQVDAEERNNRKGESLQEWARNLRYEFFRQLAGATRIVALAHHKDDLAETVVLRMARGTSALGMRAMRPEAVPFWRPLLDVSRIDLQNYVQRCGIAYREDSSNRSEEYARNRLRHRVFPVLEQLYPGASSRIAELAIEVAEMAEWSVAQYLETLGGVENLTRNNLQIAPAGIRVGMIVTAIEKRLGEGPRQWSRKFFVSLLQAPEGQFINIPGGGIIGFKNGKLRVSPRSSNFPKSIRYQQYQRSIHHWERRCLLEPGAIFADFDQPLTFDALVVQNCSDRGRWMDLQSGWPMRSTEDGDEQSMLLDAQEQVLFVRNGDSKKAVRELDPWRVEVQFSRKK